MTLQLKSAAERSLSSRDADLAAVPAAIQRALQTGKKRWGRSKLMIVGGGRAGKTALANALIGRPHVRTDSTIGISELSCDVKRASVSSDNSWLERDKPASELDAALVNMISESRRNSSAPTVALNSQPETEAVADLNANTTAFMTEGLVECAGKAPLGCEEKTDVNLPIDPLRDPISANGTEGPIDSGDNDRSGETVDRNELEDKPEQPLYDDTFIMQCIVNKLYADSKFVLSVYDFGGQEVFNVRYVL